ncbi:probable glutamate receptor [Panulirus ornatus]|uniref:probable glutamate receptor n=1 Tax=Panulirus ornatus TaxID=150431 RepID=UPI003A8B6043
MGVVVLPAVSVIVGLGMCVVGQHWLPAYHLTSLMVTDYLQFYSHQQVCLFESETGNSWVVQTTWRLARFTHSYVKVIKRANLPMETRSAGKAGQQGTHTGLINSSRDSSSSNSKVFPCGEGLTVFHLETQNDARLFKQMFPVMSVDASWLLVTAAARVTEYLGKLYLPLDSRVTIASYDENNETVLLLQAYRVSPTEKIKLEPSGIWLFSSSFTSNQQQQFKTSSSISDHIQWDSVKRASEFAENLRFRCLRFGCLEVLEGDPLLRRDDLTGVHLRCTTISSPPRMILTHMEDGSVVVSGILGSAFDYMKEVTNFTSTCTAPTDGQWGIKKNGSWTGMVAELVKGNADIALASLDITEERSSAVDFLMAIVRTDYKLVMKRPTNDDQMWSTFTSEFQVEVWWVLSLLVLVLPLAMHVATHSRYDQKLSVMNSITIVGGALCGQGYHDEFRGLPSRLMFLTVMMLHVLVLAHYTSQLVSSMAVGPPLPDISALADVRRHSPLRLGFIEGSSVTEYLRTSQSSEHQQIWQSLTPKDLVLSREEGMKRVMTHPFVFLVAENYLNNKYGKDCRYLILPKPYFPSMSAFAIRKGSPLIPVLNKIILRMKTTGLMMKWHKEWMPTPVECNDIEFSPVELRIVVTPFILLGTGMAIALFFLAAENISSNKKRKYIKANMKYKRRHFRIMNKY